MFLPRTCLVLTLMLIGGLCLSIGVFGPEYFKKLIHGELQQRLPLVNGSEIYGKWSNVSLPIHVKFRFFEVLNPDEVSLGGKPNVSEVGPFTFLESIEREVIGWSKNGKHLSFRTRKWFKFCPELSSDPLNRTVTVLNLPLVGLASMLEEKLSGSFLAHFVYSAINGIISEANETLFVRRTVGELLFEGYKVPLIQKIVSKGSEFGFTLSKTAEKEVFGLMYGKNGSSNGVWTINTGKESLDDLALTQFWNNKTSIGCWKGAECNAIRGTEGSQFPPPITPQSKLHIFSPDLYRSLTATYKEPVSVNGLTGYRFEFGDEALGAPLKSTSNECFCVKSDPDARERMCSLDGVMDISACSKGAPIVISLPHFLDGSKSLVSSINGLRPQREVHQSFFDVDPFTGVVLRVAKRLQFNMHIRNLEYVTPFANVKHLILPVNWIEETAQQDATTSAPIKQLQDIFAYANLVFVLFFGAGLALILVALIVWLNLFKKAFRDKTANELKTFPTTNYIAVDLNSNVNTNEAA